MCADLSATSDSAPFCRAFTELFIKSSNLRLGIHAYVQSNMDRQSFIGLIAANAAWVKRVNLAISQKARHVPVASGRLSAARKSPCAKAGTHAAGNRARFRQAAAQCLVWRQIARRASQDIVYQATSCSPVAARATSAVPSARVQTPEIRRLPGADPAFWEWRWPAAFILARNSRARWMGGNV